MASSISTTARRHDESTPDYASTSCQESYRSQDSSNSNCSSQMTNKHNKDTYNYQVNDWETASSRGKDSDERKKATSFPSVQSNLNRLSDVKGDKHESTISHNQLHRTSFKDVCLLADSSSKNQIYNLLHNHAALEHRQDEAESNTGNPTPLKHSKPIPKSSTVATYLPPVNKTAQLTTPSPITTAESKATLSVLKKEELFVRSNHTLDTVDTLHEHQILGYPPRGRRVLRDKHEESEHAASFSVRDNFTEKKLMSVYAPSPHLQPKVDNACKLCDDSRRSKSKERQEIENANVKQERSQTTEISQGVVEGDDGCNNDQNNLISTTNLDGNLVNNTQHNSGISRRGSNNATSYAASVSYLNENPAPPLSTSGFIPLISEATVSNNSEPHYSLQWLKSYGDVSRFQQLVQHSHSGVQEREIPSRSYHSATFALKDWEVSGDGANSYFEPSVGILASKINSLPRTPHDSITDNRCSIERMTMPPVNPSKRFKNGIDESDTNRQHHVEIDGATNAELPSCDDKSSRSSNSEQSVAEAVREEGKPCASNTSLLISSSPTIKEKEHDQRKERPQNLQQQTQRVSLNMQSYDLQPGMSRIYSSSVSSNTYDETMGHAQPEPTPQLLLANDLVPHSQHLSNLPTHGMYSSTDRNESTSAVNASSSFDNEVKYSSSSHIPQNKDGGFSLQYASSKYCDLSHRTHPLSDRRHIVDGTTQPIAQETLFPHKGNTLMLSSEHKHPHLLDNKNTFVKPEMNSSSYQHCVSQIPLSRNSQSEHDHTHSPSSQMYATTNQKFVSGEGNPRTTSLTSVASVTTTKTIPTTSDGDSNMQRKSGHHNTLTTSQPKLSSESLSHDIQEHIKSESTQSIANSKRLPPPPLPPPPPPPPPLPTSMHHEVTSFSLQATVSESNSVATMNLENTSQPSSSSPSSLTCSTHYAPAPLPPLPVSHHQHHHQHDHLLQHQQHNHQQIQVRHFQEADMPRRSCQSGQTITPNRRKSGQSSVHWTEEMTHTLLAFLRGNEYLLVTGKTDGGTNRRKREGWAQIHRQLLNEFPETKHWLTIDQVRDKFKKLKQTYSRQQEEYRKSQRSYLEQRVRGNDSPQIVVPTWPFFDAMTTLLATRTNTGGSPVVALTADGSVETSTNNVFTSWDDADGSDTNANLDDTGCNRVVFRRKMRSESIYNCDHPEGKYSGYDALLERLVRASESSVHQQHIFHQNILQQMNQFFQENNEAFKQLSLTLAEIKSMLQNNQNSET